MTDALLPLVPPCPTLIVASQLQYNMNVRVTFHVCTHDWKKLSKDIRTKLVANMVGGISFSTHAAFLTGNRGFRSIACLALAFPIPMGQDKLWNWTNSWKLNNIKKKRPTSRLKITSWLVHESFPPKAMHVKLSLQWILSTLLSSLFLI